MGAFDPTVKTVDQTNPMAAGLMKMLSEIIQRRMQSGPQQNNYAGPMGQLYQNLPKYLPGPNTGVPYVPTFNTPGTPGNGGGTTSGGTQTPNGYTNTGADPSGPDTRTAKPRESSPPVSSGTGYRGGNTTPAPRTAQPRTLQQGIRLANFDPVNAGSRSIRSFQPQYENQYTSFDPEAFLRSL